VDEHYYCADCEADDCLECGHSFYHSDDGGFEPECPCCGSMNVQP